jgi:hypothetical protein
MAYRNLISPLPASRTQTNDLGNTEYVVLSVVSGKLPGKQLSSRNLIINNLPDMKAKENAQDPSNRNHNVAKRCNRTVDKE